MTMPSDDLNPTLEALRRKTDALPRSEPDTFVSYVLHAARLAALGDSSRLLQWPSAASAAKIDVLAAIRQAAQSERESLERSDGEAISRAEDALCLRIMEPRTTNLLTEALPILDTWTLAAQQAVLGPEALEVVHHRRVSVPLDREFRLGIVAVPLDEEELRLCAALPWNAPTRISVPQELVANEPMEAFLDGGHPTPRLIERFESRKGEIQLTESAQIFQAAAELDHWWGVRVLVNGEKAMDAASVRLGTLTLARHPEDAGIFQASLHGMALATKLRLLTLDICIRMRDGGRLIL